MRKYERHGLIPNDFPLSTDELRAKLLSTLRALPSDDELQGLYPYGPDRVRVRRRLMLRVAHDLIFKNIIEDVGRIVEQDGSIEVRMDKTEDAELLSDLSAALRDFSHDAERLDQGIKPELVLPPVEVDAADRDLLISAERKIILLALLYIEFKSPYVTEKEQIKYATESTGLAAGTLRTYIRDMRKAQKTYRSGQGSQPLSFSHAEYDYYIGLRAKIAAIAGRKQAGSAADLIAPALRGLGTAYQKVRKRKSAKR